MEKQVKKPRKLSIAIVSLLLAALIAGNVACGMYAGIITQYFAAVDVDEAATSAAAAVAASLVEEVQGEGTVLLENKNNALPLDQSDARQKKINVFGWSSTSPVYGGNGSGAANEKANVSFLDGLTSAGFEVNSALTEFYQSFSFERQVVNSMGRFEVSYKIPEVAASDYSDSFRKELVDYSDVAVIFLSRIGGEGADLPMDMSSYDGRADQHYLELSDTERDLIDMVSDMGFRKVVAVINSSHAMELGFLEDEGIDAALWVGGPGQTGFRAVGQLLSGEITPSGRLVDTYAYDLTTNPTYYNFGGFNYSNSENSLANGRAGEVTGDWLHFVDYAEGIYVGYRFYETRFIDNLTGECDEEAYAAAVQYPFGYGLSYTSFQQKIADYSCDGETVQVAVNVTNTGNAPGKDVVQIYYTAPYTIGGIEKSHVALIAFEKTALLEPGQSETVNISFRVDEMASFDYAGSGCYVLDSGDYQIKLMNNAHEVLDSRTYTVMQTVRFEGDNKRASDLIPATIQLADVQGEVQYVSRADWEGTLPTARTPERDADPAMMDAMLVYLPEPDNSVEDIIIQDNGLKLADLSGLAYDDPKWELLLQQLSVEDMQNLIGHGAYATPVIDSIHKPYTVELDGPAGVNSVVRDAKYSTVQYNSEVVIASTWNKELSRRMGEAYGAEANAYGISGLYAPAMNTHRSSFGGRNFEYYSEDGVLGGWIAANVTAGIQSQGVYCYLKHFALNDQDTNRQGLCVWANEQAIREIYLKPFEIAVKEGGALGVMASLNRLGSMWTGAHKGLMTNILREEWGFCGAATTDMDTRRYLDPDQGNWAGTDLMLAPAGDVPTDTSNAGKQAMRNASHHILYTVANSNAIEINYFGPTAYWLYALIALDIIAAGAAAVFFYRWVKKSRAYAAASKPSGKDA